MQTEEIKALAYRFMDDWDKGKTAYVAEIDEMLAPDVIFHGWSGNDYGLKDYKQKCNELFNAFPDIHWTIEDMLVEGDKVAVRYTMTGTNKGEFMGSHPTNKKVTFWGIDIHRVSDGKIVECWSRIDAPSLMKQLSPALVHA